MIAIDFFCGCGGLTRGLLDAGIKVRLGIDNDESARATYTRNNNVDFLDADLTNLPINSIRPYLSSRNLLLFAGCAPCQPFSKLHHKGRNTGIGDALLLKKFEAFVTHYRPHFVFSENVPEIVKCEIYDEFKIALIEQGYSIDDAILDFSLYGVPQKRRRNVLLAALGRPIKIPQSTGRVRSVGDQIRHYPPIEAGNSYPSVPNHVCSGLSELNLRRLKFTPVDGGDSRAWPESLLPKSREGGLSYYDVYGRMAWDEPAPTLTTRCNSYSSGRFGHPEQNRAISIREAAALQTFGDDYIFEGTLRSQARQIGNAVPPLIARIMGKEIRRCARRYRQEK